MINLVIFIIVYLPNKSRRVYTVPSKNKNKSPNYVNKKTGQVGSENGQFCWRSVLYLCWHSGWVRKSPKYADIIQGWFLSRLLNSKVIIGNLDICLLSSNLHCVEVFSKAKLLNVYCLHLRLHEILLKIEYNYSKT